MNGDDSVIRLLRKVQGRKKNKHTTSDVKSLMACLEVLRGRRVEGSKGEESSGEESRGE